VKLESASGGMRLKLWASRLMDAVKRGIPHGRPALKVPFGIASPAEGRGLRNELDNLSSGRRAAVASIEQVDQGS